MSKVIRKIAILAILTCMLFTFMCTGAYADGTADAAQCWNIMLVIDGSRSLSSGIGGVATDPDGLRYEAIDGFIDTLQDEGQYVGAIMFMANPGNGTSEEDMYKGIRLDTWKDGPIAIDNNKATLKKQIRNANLYSSESGDIGETDIGTALYWAEKRLSEAHDENGLPCALFLFTDGLNALTYPGPQAQSEENMSIATANLRDKGVAVCGVFLNTSEKQIDSTEVRDIVCDANGISSGDLDLGNYFIEINTPADCSNSTDKFMEMLGFSFGDEFGETITSSCDKQFRVPGTGVEEVNIRIRTLDGESLPEKMSVSITKPDGTELNGVTTAAICSAGRTYQIYKISEPESGTWNIHIELPKDNTVEVNYNPIFSIYIDSGFESTPSADNLHANMNTDVECFLSKNGEQVTSSDDYREYECKLEVTNVSSGEVTEYPVTQNGNGEFKISVPLDYGTYDVRSEFSCDKLSVSSAKTTWYLENTAPALTGVNDKINYSIFNIGGLKADLSERFADNEDGNNLEVSLIDTGADGLSIDGTKLVINPFKAKGGEYGIRVTDSQRAYTDFSVKIVNKTIPYVIALLCCLLVLAIIVFLIIRKINSYIPQGICTAEFDVEAEDDRGNEKEVTLNIELTPPGKGSKRSTTLYDLLDKDLKMTAGKIKEACDEENISKRDVERLIDDIESGLRNIKIKCAVAKQKKKGKVAKVRVICGKTNTLLYNNSVKLEPGGKAINFGYFLREMDDSDMEEYENYSSYSDDYDDNMYSSNTSTDDPYASDDDLY